METIDFEFDPYSEKYMRFLQAVHGAGYTVRVASQHHPYKQNAFYVTTEVDSGTSLLLRLTFPEDTRVRPVMENYASFPGVIHDNSYIDKIIYKPRSYYYFE